MKEQILSRFVLDGFIVLSDRTHNMDYGLRPHHVELLEDAMQVQHPQLQANIPIVDLNYLSGIFFTSL